MKVKCIRTLIDNPPRSISESGWKDAGNSLTIGKLYTVFAINHRGDCDWYLICDDNYNDMGGYNYPVYIPALFFLIKDHHKPGNWAVFPRDNCFEGPPELSFEYYEKIVEGDPSALSSFRKELYKYQELESKEPLI